MKWSAAQLWFLFSVCCSRISNAFENGTCLPNGVVPEMRENFTNGDGESYPMGIVVATWVSAQLTSAAMEILISEVLGYNIRIDPTAAASSIDAIYGALGCATWTNITNRGCDNRKIRIHFMSESWMFGRRDLLDDLRNQYKADVPLGGGDMGYVGDAGLYVQQSVIDAAQSAEGLALEYYKSYNASWHSPWLYFDALSGINITGSFMKCSESLLNDNSTVFSYWKISGDDDGVIVTNKKYAAKCLDDYLWKSPTCRSDSAKCILWVTGGDGWDLVAVMQRSAVFNMPIACGVASGYGNYLAVNKQHKTLLYWWTPDNSFLDVNPTLMQMAPHSAFQWTQGDQTTTVGTELAKMVSSDLRFLSPEVAKFVESVQFELSEVNDLMRAFQAENATRLGTACDWLKANEARWKGWIPDPTLCLRGFGLYDEVNAVYPSSRLGATTCRACPPGTYSKIFADGVGETTYLCEVCGAGTQQPAAGAAECEVCPQGTSKAKQTTDDCTPCAPGSYQDEQGQISCKACPAGTTTLLLGVKSGWRADCGCTSGNIDVESDSAQAAICQPCSDGLHCPILSTLDILHSGTSPLGDDFVAKILPGFFSTRSKPLEVFKCTSEAQCPGGTPNTCGADRIGTPCGECPSSTFWNKSKCAECSTWALVGWIIGVVLIFLCLIFAYYFLNAPMTAKASTLFSTTCGIGMMINMLQTLGIIGGMTVDWPVTLGNILGVLQIFAFDIDGLGFACISGSNAVIRYVTTVVFFPCGLVWLCSCGFISRLTSNWRWDRVKLNSTMGQFLQVGFSTMSSTALVPLICYSHPNGQQSNLKNPNIFCGSEDHTLMVIFGVLLLVFGVCGFLSVCAWLAYRCPHYSNTGRYDLVQSSKFLLGRFRLDVWWYGVPLLVRGPLLALTVVIAPDTPALQVLFCQIILLSYMSLQLYHWPWKAPILNVVDFLSCFLITFLVVVTGFYIPAVTGDLESTFATLSTIVLGLLFAVVGLMVALAVLALFYRAAIGSQKELAIMTAGKTPPPSAVSDDLFDSLQRLNPSTKEDIHEQLEILDVYDLKCLIAALTVLKSEVLPALDVRRASIASASIASRTNSINSGSLGSSRLTSAAFKAKQNKPSLRTTSRKTTQEGPENWTSRKTTQEEPEKQIETRTTQSTASEEGEGHERSEPEIANEPKAEDNSEQESSWV
eukprot:symbB.v1.2.002451.t1/scaffold99.1/size346285/7